MRSLTLALGLLVLLGGAAHAGTPGPKARQKLLGLGTCDAGPNAGKACVDGFDCDDTRGAPGSCSTPIAEVAVRGVLTLVSDKDASNWLDVTAIPETKDAKGNVVPTDFTRSTLTMVLEFTRNGHEFAFAETFQDLGDYVNTQQKIDCGGFCVPSWREPAVENRIATPSIESDEGDGGADGGGQGQASSPGIRISWATPPPAIGKAIVEALGLPAGATPFLEVVNTTAIFDHSAESDPLASVRRLKVTIRALLPVPTP